MAMTDSRPLASMTSAVAVLMKFTSRLTMDMLDSFCLTSSRTTGISLSAGPPSRIAATTSDRL